MGLRSVIVMAIVVAATPPTVAETGEVACDAELLAAEGGRASAWPLSAPTEAVDRCLASCVTAPHILLYEDTQGVLVDPGSTSGDEVQLEADAANELISLYGDRFDFIGFWTNFDPTTRVGGANFRNLYNQSSGFGLGPIDQRASLGLNSDRVQGFVTMYDLHLTANWDLNVTLDHEFGHRWMVFMLPLLDGRVMRSGAHAQTALDAQGGMHAVDWAGDLNPKCRDPANNADTGVVWGWMQLYLMGYADQAETDAGMSQQRYMDDSVDSCPNQPYGGPVSTWTVQDIIDANGERLPAAADARKHFRTGWILIHQPGNPPGSRELDDLASLLDGYCDRWSTITLGRGTMTQTLFDDCDCSGLPNGGCPGCADDADCDDELFCNGAETCDVASGDCLPGGAPCAPDEVCDEPANLCVGCNDQDGDGYGSPGLVVCPAGPGNDCNDADPNTYPGAPEICDGAANDCTGFAWPTVPNDELDGDADGWVACSPWQGDEPGVSGGGDCDPNDGTTHPGAPERNDGLDNQCPGDPGFGVVDETSGDSGFHDPADRDRYCWDPQTGATEYEVRRSGAPSFPSGCAGTTTTETCWTDSELPPGGSAFHYLNRPLSPLTGSWGQDSTGSERTDICP